MVAVGTDAGCVGHHVGDVVLLVDAVQQVRHGALGKDGYVLPAVGLVAQGHSGLSLVVVVGCGPEKRLLSACQGPGTCSRLSVPASGLAQMPSSPIFFRGGGSLCAAPGILVPQPGTKPVPPALGVWSR